MPGARPRREQEEEPRVAASADLVALVGIEDGQQPGPPGDALTVVALDLDLAVDHDQVGALVDLMVLQLLAGRQVQGDRARLAARGVQDLRLVRLDAEAREVPVLHAGAKTTSLRPPRAAARSTAGSGATRAFARRRRCRRSRTG